jgi:hypothetical protein
VNVRRCADFSLRHTTGDQDAVTDDELQTPVDLATP